MPIGAAAAQGAEKPQSAVAAANPENPATTGPSSSGGSKGGGNTMPEVDLTDGEPNTTGPTRRPISSDGPDSTDTSSNSSTSSDDPDADAAARADRKRIRVPLIRVGVTGTTTWRSQCLRPGVSTCAEYDTLGRIPEGVTINFGSSVPYLGFAANLELFPLARLNNQILQGFGVLGGFQYGSSLTRIVEMTAAGSGPEKLVTSTDLGWNMQLAWRFHFNAGYGDKNTDADGVVTEVRPVAYVGLRGGLQARNFLIDPSAMLPFPSSERVSPTGIGFLSFGLDASVPVSKYFRIEAAASLFINPHPGPDQIIGYGNLNDETGGATATGFSVEGGFAGDIYGPLGWQLRLKHMAFADRYYGQGQKWTVCNNEQCGGAGEESFTSINWGLTVAW